MNELHAATREPAPQTISTVLIIDDEREVVRLVTLMLGQSGYLCVGCESIRDALPLMDTRHFDAVLCELHLPDSGGLELLRSVRQRYRRLGFVMMTGEVDPLACARAMREGADDYLLKPFSKEALQTSIVETLRRKKREVQRNKYWRRED